MTRASGAAAVTGDQTPAAPAFARMRVDKWLWAARFYRTRTLAAAAVEAGQVRINGERVKPAHAIGAGNLVEVRRQALSWTVEVLALADRRGGAPQAALLYRETADSVQAREKAIGSRQAAGVRGGARPTKKDRRSLEDFLNEP
jgi:ribosome-associated heat shock protein Hsp15